MTRDEVQAGSLVTLVAPVSATKARSALPAALRLLGAWAWAWWTPGWLKRILPDVRFGHA